MDQGIISLLYILAGVNIAFATVNLSIGLQKESEKAYLFLGLIGVFISIYYLMFPYLDFSKDLPWKTILGFSFFLSTFALLPWFFGAFTGYKKIFFQIILSAGMAFSMVILIWFPSFGPFALWNVIAHTTLIGIIIYGMIASYYQINSKGRTDGRVLFVGVLFLALLTVDDIIRMHLPQYYPFNVNQQFLPLDYFMVVFIMVMGLKMILDIQQKYRLEKQNANKEKRWKNLLTKIQLFVVQLDENGKIIFVNPFLLLQTGYMESEIIGKNWFETYIIESERKPLLDTHKKFLDTNEHIHYQNAIITKIGEELQVYWSNLQISDEEGNHIGSISIGANITEREAAFKEIKRLKTKLEEENIKLKADSDKGMGSSKIMGKSDAIRYVLKRALLVSPTTSTVLLEGETGVGKELIANYIQKNSDLSDKPFIKLNCAAIPASLIESELFGHEKGAFTGANKRKSGMVEMANGGTLFLDEIAELPMELQAKLLRFLQEGEYLPLGSNKTKNVNVRIITATNKELLKEIEKGNFRNDLYYRLYVYPITIPTLKNRKSDIPILAESFISTYAIKHKKHINSVSKLLMDELMNYDWPGNIRELENVIERAVIISEGSSLKKKDVNIFENTEELQPKPKGKLESLEDVERAHIIKALIQSNWRIHGKTGAAEILKINPSTLRSRIKKLDIQRL